jgi:hypothetical protein
MSQAQIREGTMRIESSGKPDVMKVACPVWGWGRDATSRPTPQLIGDVPSATAILDRILQHAEIIEITGKSYRLRGAAEAKGKSTSQETAS